MNMKRVWLFVMPVLFLASCTASRTPTPDSNLVSDILESKAAQIRLTLEDMPDHFVNLDSESNRMIGEENLLDIQSAFSFHSDAGNLEKIIGMTTVYPYLQRDPSDGMDRIRQQIELITRSMVKGFVFARDVDVEDLVFNKPAVSIPGNPLPGPMKMWVIRISIRGLKSLYLSAIRSP